MRTVRIVEKNGNLMEVVVVHVSPSDIDHGCLEAGKFHTVDHSSDVGKHLMASEHISFPPVKPERIDITNDDHHSSPIASVKVSLGSGNHKSGPYSTECVNAT